ncbi:hypothetical protein [Streptomyces sp. NPDC051776]|uniref:hypothetical protein n=1 Tax=Streptomyces sp. NPDC051776 TaxID=3155414 RepID=UPI003442D7C9
MRAHKIATATMLVLAVSGWAGVAGIGLAYAETGPDHGAGKAKAADKGHEGRAKARAEGGSSTGGDLFQQDVAQAARQNNNCNNPNMDSDSITLTDSRATGRCVTSDGSLTAFSLIHDGPAEADGGSAARDAVQQNVAQRGRQNNNCHNINESNATLDSGRLESSCTDQDHSITTHSLVKGRGARAVGGNAGGTDVFQQNIAQVGRQNNNCSSLNLRSNLTVTGSQVEARCGNKDGSFSKHTHLRSGGARAEGGSSTDVDVFQQNLAQEGRQNNNCNQFNSDTTLDVTGGGRAEARCGNKDRSFNKHTRTTGGGAGVEGGTASSSVSQQNIAQEGRQNNNCNNPNLRDAGIDVTGGRLTARCGNKDGSFNKHTHLQGGGARVEGGSSTVEEVNQQNVAQEGRQNNNCHSGNDTNAIDVAEGRLDVRCGNKDRSFNKHTRVEGGGARVEGGDAMGDDVSQQNLAQAGRQNNNCSHFNAPESSLDLTGGGRVDVRCGNKDRSFNKHTHLKGGGARVEGGSSTAGTFAQQNVAQQGRQNNTCANLNSTTPTLEGSRSQVSCQTVDRSANLGTADIGGGAKTTGGDATADLFQQNTAQEGRQNNSCSNSNNLTFTATSSRSQNKCVAIDRSTNIHTEDW